MSVDLVPAIRRIAQRCIERGRPVEWIPGWETRGSGRFIAVEYVVDHFDAFSPRSGTLGGLRTCTFGRPDLRNSLCMFYIGDRGQICVVAALISWHAGIGKITSNSRAAGIEARNDNLGELMHPEMEASYRILNEEMIREWKLPSSRVIEHREHSTTGKSDRRGVDADRWRASLSLLPDPPKDDDMAPPILARLSDRSEVYLVAGDLSSRHQVTSKTSLDGYQALLGIGGHPNQVNVWERSSPLGQMLIDIPHLVNQAELRRMIEQIASAVGERGEEHQRILAALPSGTPGSCDSGEVADALLSGIIEKICGSG